MAPILVSSRRHAPAPEEISPIRYPALAIVIF